MKIRALLFFVTRIHEIPRGVLIPTAIAIGTIILYSTVHSQDAALPRASPVPPAPTAPAAPIRAVPLAPENSAPTGPPMTNQLPPQKGSRNAPVDPVKPIATIPGAAGVTISEMQSDSHVIENERPQRVKVYPDDPESAWWEINPSHAFKRAQREQKPLMLLFTGIWNTQAMKLSEEVFSTKSFNDYVKENLIICFLNYPRNPSDAPDSLRRVKEKFNVRGLPNVLLFNPNGEVVRGKAGYRSGLPVDYFIEFKNACHPVLQAVETQKSELERQGYRDWSNFIGKVIFAKYVSRNETMVALRDATGQVWKIPKNDLSPEDQKIAESFPIPPSRSKSK